MQLFDDFTRTESSSSNHRESEYDFLNRSCWNVSVRARDLCTAWFEKYPTTEQADLCARFTEDDAGQHLGAYFELVLHELLRRLGFSVTVHPTVPGVSARPDFLAESGNHRFYLEATVSQASSAEIPNNATLNQIYEWIDEIDNPYFLVGIRPSCRPTKQPSRKFIQAHIRRLMAEGDPELLLRRLENGLGRPANFPSVTIELDGCNLFVELWPKPREKWGVSAGRTIAARSGAAWYGVGAGDVASTLGAVIDKKAREKRVARLDAPLVVACSTVDGFYKFSEEGLVSLFGRHNLDYGAPDWNVHLGEPRIDRGAWVDRSGAPRNDNLAAVWLFGNARPVATTPTGYGNRLFLNPSSRQPIPDELLSVARAQIDNGRMIWTDGLDLSELLGVSEIPYEILRKAGAA